MKLSRRQFVSGAGVAGLGLLGGCGRLPWQAPPRTPRLGFLAAGIQGTEADNPFVQAFRDGLREYGHVDGQTVVIAYRYSDGHDEQLPDLAAELVNLPVDVLVTPGETATAAASRATTTIPIVQMAGGGDLVEAGLIASLARPSGNVTGLTRMAPQLMGKRLELLTRTVPGVTRVAVVRDAANAANAPTATELETAAGLLSVELQTLESPGANGLKGAFEATTRERVNALLVVRDPLTFNNRQQIAALAARARLPAMYESREFVEAGGLMSYGPSVAAQFRRSAYYVDRILKGAKPADLPVEQPMTFDFVVNMKTARALGITFPPEILLQVTEVIDG